MNEEIKSALKRSILKSLPILQKLSPNYQEPYLFWIKQEEGRWRGEHRQRVCVPCVFRGAENQLQEAASEFANLFFSTYPQYGEGKLVGICGLGSMQLAHDRACILKSAVGYLWEMHETFDCHESDVDQVIDDFEKFVELPTIQLRIQAELINFQMPAPTLQLADGLAIRRLNEREISTFHGGSLIQRMHHSWFISEFVIEGDMEVTKAIAGEPVKQIATQEIAFAKLDKAMRCLRTFKEGSIGYDWLHFKFVKFCPLALGSYGSLDQHVRPGIYKLSEKEVVILPDYAQRIFSLSESALQTACARLADAEARLRPQDQILDAIIGMEALLLAGLGKEDRRSELKYRFSLNYSTMFGSGEERWQAYNLAKDLYDHRSTIAHGGDLSGNGVRVGEKQCNINEVAMIAKGELRKLIKRFLPHANSAPYKKPRYWERAYFGISDPK
jgi:hypothetical protein